MEIIKHFSHPDHHPLKLVKSIEGIRKVPNCRCCKEVMCFPGYACVYKGYCKGFYLHKSCAELAQEISHPLHHHPLNLLSEIRGEIICDGCRNLYKEGFTYYCSWSCGFNLHPKCASKHDHEELLQQQTFNKELTLYHFCHKHALNFCNLRKSDEKSCCCCKQRISGSAYCCLQCRFFIHESCKEIPKQVQHPFHPQHLLLTQAVEFKILKYDASDWYCNACKSSINGVRISCNMCKFNLHVSCANPNRWACALNHPCHEHNMYYFIVEVIKRWISFFECNKCHEKCLDDEAFYRCVECDFNLHLKCIPIPSVVMITQKHHHPLTLIDSVKEDNPLIQYLMDSNDTVDYSMDYYCDICETPGNPKRHAYCCKECNYIAHVECIISKKDTPLEIPSNLNPTGRHSTGTEPKKEQKMSDEADFHPAQSDRNTEQAAQNMSKKNEELFSHPSHPRHKLTLLQQEESSKEIKYCKVCNEVMCYPGYACEHCSWFYLHKSCAELAQEISHPLHHHPLTLLSEIPRSYEGIICYGCRDLYENGFTYYCSWSCGFNLDLKCASKHDHEELLQQQTFNKELTLYHFCHKHALNFCNLSRESYYKPCCCCKKIIRGSAYCCLECGFFIHESCKEIPKQVQHPFHPQHLLLAQPMDEVDFKSCDACKSLIHGIRISCNMCKFNLHVSCANPNRWACALKHPCHEYNMYYFIVEVIKGWIPIFKCNKCHAICLGDKAFYRCVECDFNLHLECIPIPSVAMVTRKHHHPLTLIDSVKEDNPLIQYLMDSNDKVDLSMDYYCDVCETPGNPKHHAYCCKECIYIAHVECIISKDNTSPEIISNLNPTHGAKPKKKQYTRAEIEQAAQNIFEIVA